ncbi:hypothetical protein DFH09DRAFT_1420994, partial [Mycena vulgaris]
WDGWPDGDFSATFSMPFVEQHDNLHVHWASAPLGGRGGSTEAPTWEGGKVTRRRCQGVIECESDACAVVTRPQTRRTGIEKQLAQACACGEKLVHHACDVVSVLHTFQDGVHYQNGGTHDHSRPTVRLHMGKKERQEFTRIVRDQPATGPLRLLVGRPGVNGPGDSVADISPVLVNADRIKYERRKILQGRGPGGHGGDNFIKEFAKFEAANPGFIRTSQFGLVSVIVMQTSFMAARLIKSSSVDAEAVNGIVSDAAHGVWRERNSLLIVSSTYEPVQLKCWVPGIVSYSNGGTIQHYRIHFFELFVSMAEECDARGIEVTDDLFANVMDFSASERGGFIWGFIDFWLQRAPGVRTVDQLQQKAPKLLKGCGQHFRNQITRVKKISGIVDPSQTDVFENYAKQLLKCKTVDQFTAHANEFINTFPKAETWIRWWMLPAHACMIFPSFRVMEASLWESIPDTTNAEEAMHWKLYAAVGKSLGLMEGLNALVKFAAYYSAQFDAKKRWLNPYGIKIHYGVNREHWKATAELHGRTKYSRQPGARQNSKNDGRPPDTGKALLGRRKGKTQAPEFEKGSHPLLDLRQLMYTKLTSVDLPGYQDGGSTTLGYQRDGFRKILRDLPRSEVKSLTDLQTLFVSPGVLHRGEQVTPTLERAISYFRMRSVILRSCSGSGPEHLQLERIKWRKELQLHSTLCQKYQGDMRQWFTDLLRPTKAEPLAGCWHARDGALICQGNAILFEIILNIPVVLIIEISDINSGNHWHIPSSLYPFANSPSATTQGVKYSITSHLYCNPDAGPHFIARYSSFKGDKTRIFNYDGMKHEGHAILQSSSTLKGNLSGSTKDLKDVPDGYFLYAVIYHLDGGEGAQNFFRREQVKRCAKLGLHFET